jgi:hypothetical protein
MMIAERAEPMKHFDPKSVDQKSAKRLPGHPASVVRVCAPLALRSYAAGLLVGASERLGSIPAENLVGLEPQSKRFFACLNCGGVMAEA